MNNIQHFTAIVSIILLAPLYLNAGHVDTGVDAGGEESILSFIRTDQLQSGLSSCSVKSMSSAKALCEGELANRYCPYWEIEYSVGLIWTSITCTTGGKFKCEDGDTCNCITEDEVTEEK